LIFNHLEENIFYNLFVCRQNMLLNRIIMSRKIASPIMDSAKLLYTWMLAAPPSFFILGLNNFLYFFITLLTYTKPQNRRVMHNQGIAMLMSICA